MRSLAAVDWPASLAVRLMRLRRLRGAESLDRAHRTFFWGSKMMDRTCATACHAPAHPEGQANVSSPLFSRTVRSRCCGS